MIKTVPLPLLQQLATQVQTTIDINNSTENANISATDGMDWLNQWSAHYSPELTGQFNPIANGGRLARTDCPWNPAHGRDAYVHQLPNGAISAGCHHASCAGKDWHDYRAAKEPGYQQGQGGFTNTVINTAIKNNLGNHQWATPMPLTLQLTAEPPMMDKALIHASLLAYCEDVAYRKQAPIEYVITALLMTVSCLLGNKIVIYAKQKDIWTATVNLWAMIIGEPSRVKTPVINEATRFLKVIEDDFKNTYKNAKRDYHVLVKSLEGQIAQLNKTKKKTDQTQQQIDQLQVQLDQLNANPPKLKRRIVKDTTIEKLQMILGDNPEGCMLLWDELATFFAGLEKAGRETDRGFLLEAWNGLNSYTVDRVTRESVIIDKLCLSILGTIQPEVLLKYARQSIDKHGSDGFLPRFQLVIFPPRGGWEYTDAKPDPDAQKHIETITAFLNTWNPSEDSHSADYRNDIPGQIGVSFSPEAQALFARWNTELHHSLLNGSIESDRMTEHLAKYPMLMLKLSLIFHCTEYATTSAIPPLVDELTAARAIAWCEYLGLHAERLYGVGKVRQDDITKTALALLDKVKAGKLKAGMTINDIIKHDWSGLKNSDDVTVAIHLLEENGWLRTVPTTGSGRPTSKLDINPNAQPNLKERSGYAHEIVTEERPRPWLGYLKNLLEPDNIIELMAASSLLLTEMDDEDDGTATAGIASITGTLTATDVDAGATQVWSLQGSPSTTYGTLALDASTGIWTYTLDNTKTATQALKENDDDGTLSAYIPVDTAEDVTKVRDLLDREGRSYDFAPYVVANGLALLPKGVNGPVFKTDGSGFQRGSDLDEWIEEHAPRAKAKRAPRKRTR